MRAGREGGRAALSETRPAVPGGQQGHRARARCHQPAAQPLQGVLQHPTAFYPALLECADTQDNVTATSVLLSHGCAAKAELQVDKSTQN